MSPHFSGRMSQLTVIEYVCVVLSWAQRSKMDQESKTKMASGGVNVGGGRIHVEGDIVGGNKYVYQAPDVTLPAPHHLPPPPRDFVGRTEEIAELVAAVE